MWSLLDPPWLVWYGLPRRLSICLSTLAMSTLLSGNDSGVGGAHFALSPRIVTGALSFAGKSLDPLLQPDQVEIPAELPANLLEPTAFCEAVLQVEVDAGLVQ